MDKSEIAKVERYLRRTFANHSIRVVGRPKKDDLAEVYIGEEFVGDAVRSTTRTATAPTISPWRSSTRISTE